MLPVGPGSFFYCQTTYRAEIVVSMHDEITTKSKTLSLSIEAVVLTLMAIGTVFVFSAGASVKSDYSLKEFYNSTTLKQLLFFPAAVVVMYGVASLDHKRLSFTRAGFFKSATTYLMGISLILLVLVLIPGIGTPKNDSWRWIVIKLGPASVSFQPSELAKWCVLFFIAAFVDKFQDRINSFVKFFVPVCIVPGVVVGLIVTQDFGTAAFISLLSFLMLLMAGCSIFHFIVPLSMIGPAFWYAVTTSVTRMNRIKAFLHPEDTSNPAWYQVQQSLIAISSGGLFGTGLGRGISKYGHLPEDTTDFIFAIISEELGLAGAVTVILLFLIFLILGLSVSLRTKDKFSSLLAAGIVLTIVIQAAINIGVVTVVLPTKGIPLPFISAGGTSMLLTSAAIGVLLNIAANPSEE